MNHLNLLCCEEFSMGDYCINVRKHQMKYGCTVSKKFIYCKLCKCKIKYRYRNVHITIAKHLKALKALEDTNVQRNA